MTAIILFGLMALFLLVGVPIVAVSNIIGTMTPPVAVNLFSAASFSKLKMGEIAKGEMPFLTAALIVYTVVVFVPRFSTILLGR